MEGQSKLKYSLIIIIVLLLLLGAYFVYQSSAIEKPYEVVTQRLYSSTSTVSLYKNIPPGFPKELILENKRIDYSGIFKTPTGSETREVRYITDKTVSDIKDMYKDYLPKIGWTVLPLQETSNSVTIQGIKGVENIQIIIISKEEGGAFLILDYYEREVL